MAPEPPAPDPEASRAFLASIGEPSSPLAIASQTPRVTTMALENTALGEAPGMEPGTLWAAALAPGRRATTRLELGPADCTTFIAQGGLGTVEVDLFVTVGQGADLRIVAEDASSGPIAIIGGRAGCFRLPPHAPPPADLHVRMRHGAGIVVVRAYRGGA